MAEKANSKSIKQQLFSFRTLVINIRTTERALNRVQARLYDLPSLVGETVKVHHEDRKPELLTSIERLRAELDAMNEERRIRLLDLQPIVYGIHAPKEQSIIKYRYIMAMDWEEITEIVFGGEQGYKRKKRYYQQRCYEIHTDAMRSIK